MTKISITKMQGCGNDFVIIDFDEYKKTGLSMPELAKKICDRHFGVGADGMIIPDLTPNEQTDIAWHFYNSDGSSAQMCGNGIRCFAKYVYDKKLVKDKKFTVKTLAGTIIPELLDNDCVKVDMGIPILEEEKIPFKGEKNINIKDKTFQITPVSMGNPHCVIFTKEDTMKMAKTYGADIETHPYFPEKTNTEFVRILSRDEIELTVFERGCGITLACGTGACASVVAGVLNNLTDEKVKVNLTGGAVFIDWSEDEGNHDKHIFMTGPAQYSFYAEYML